MPVKTDAEHLDELKTWRDNILTALKTPETVGAYGGMPDASGGGPSVARMPGRSQLLTELRWLDDEIALIQARVDGAFEVTSEMMG